MTPSLLDRLRQELPADWQHGDASSEAWYADPIRTVYLTIGDRRLFVSARADGSLVGERGGVAVLPISGQLLAQAVEEGHTTPKARRRTARALIGARASWPSLRS